MAAIQTVAFDVVQVTEMSLVTHMNVGQGLSQATKINANRWVKCSFRVCRGGRCQVPIRMLFFASHG